MDKVYISGPITSSKKGRNGNLLGTYLQKNGSPYQPVLSYPIELKNPTLEQFCRQTYDPELYYNPESTVV